MKIHDKDLSDVCRYIENCKHITLEDKEQEFKAILGHIKMFRDIGPQTKILEIGTGIGWFPILCKKNGMHCKGIEISWQLVDYSHQFGRKYGIEQDIELGNIEETDIGTSTYDIIVACSTFEHVEYWQKGIEKVFNALKPGGLFYFYSTNKFSLKSGEYNFPLYGWLPNRWRYRLRMSRQGEDIMHLGIDFNQFTYFQLRQFFKKVGFSTVLDIIEILNPGNLVNPTPEKKAVLRILKRFPPLRHLVLLFYRGTSFICIK